MRRLRVGFDAVRIDRMEKKMQRAGFCSRVFSAQENALFAEKKHPAPTAAETTSAGEAVPSEKYVCMCMSARIIALPPHPQF